MFFHWLRSCSGRFYVHVLSIIFFTALPAGEFASAQQDTEPGRPPVINEWEVTLDPDAIQRLYLKEKIWDILFDAVDDLDFSQSIGDAKISLRTNRRVYDNHDPSQSWTVVDRFKLEGKVPLLNSVLDTVGSTGTLGFNIGARAGMEFINIRQVIPANYASLPSIEDRKKEIESAPWYNELINQAAEARRESATERDETDPAPAGAPRDPEGEWVYNMGAHGSRQLSYVPSDPENQVKFAKLWNLLLFPFRFPVNASGVQKMDPNEIISYVASGYLGVGPSIGFELEPTGSVIGAGLSYTAFLHGEFKVSILKENDRYARMKVTRMQKQGSAIGVGSDANSTWLDGIFLVEKLQSQIKIVPFSLAVSKSISDAFDVGYRYDLTVPAAREAYERAVLGRLEYSDRLAVDAKGQPTDFAKTGVAKLFTRKTHTTSSTISRKFQLGFIYKRRGNTSYETVETTIKTPEGKKHVFQALVENTQEWKAVWGSYEKLRHAFAVNIDLDLYSQNPQSPESMTFVAEGAIEDSDTNAKEMINYILEVENAVGQFGIFPRPPLDKKAREYVKELSAATDERSVVVLPKNALGKSRLFYRIGLNRRQIEKLIDFPENKMWPALEKAFGASPGSWSSQAARNAYRVVSMPFTLLNLPLYLADLNIRQGSDLWHAEKIQRRWERIRRRLAPMSRGAALGKMFFDSLYSYELVRLLRSTMDQEIIPYTVTAYNPIFGGNLYKKGNGTLSHENVATKMQKEIDFDQPGSRPQSALPNFTVPENLKIAALAHKRFEVSFSLKETPKALYIQILRDDSWFIFGGYESKAQILAYNAGEFTAGENRIILDASDKESPWLPIASKFKSDERFKLRIATNNDGMHWGPATSVTFKVKKRKK